MRRGLLANMCSLSSVASNPMPKNAVPPNIYFRVYDAERDGKERELFVSHEHHHFSLAVTKSA